MTTVTIVLDENSQIKEQAIVALENIEKFRKEKARKEIIKHVASRKVAQKKRNESFWCRIGLLSKDAFPEDEMSSYFVDNYMKTWSEDALFNIWDIPIFRDMDEAPEWWNAADFEFASDLVSIMQQGSDYDRRLREFLVALDYGPVTAETDLISFINEWSS